jgi:hypothetical protein
MPGEPHVHGPGCDEAHGGHTHDHAHDHADCRAGAPARGSVLAPVSAGRIEVRTTFSLPPKPGGTKPPAE